MAVRSSRIKFLSACIVCSSANPLSTSQKSISAATRRRPGRSAQAVAVNCGYWTKAIALKRVPEHLHICSQAAIALWRCPASRAPSATNSVAPLKDLPFCKPSRWLQHTVKMWLRPCGKNYSAGATIGSGARCPRPQSPHVRNNSNNFLSSAGSTSFPV